MLQKISLRGRLKNSLGKTYVILAVSVLLFSGCSNKTYFDSTTSVDESGWDFSNILSYDIPIQDTIEHYDLILSLEYQKNYPYRNIFFFVDVEAPSKATYRDTIECLLGTPSGYLLGEESGDAINQDLIYRQNIHFPQKGIYKIRVQHAMRDTLLHGFRSVGIKLLEHSENK